MYSFSLTVPIPLPLGLELRNGIISCVVLGILILLVSHLPKGALGDYSNLLAMLLLFGAPLSALWTSGISEPSVIGGLLPNADARQYLQGAMNLSAGSTLTPGSSERPLFPALLGFLLTITQHNLKISLSVLVAVNALACYSLSRELRFSHGVVAAISIALITFLFYRRFSGTFLTENLGFALGVIALALFFRAINRQSVHLFAIGLLSLALALSARAGAFFVLPILLFWGINFFTKAFGRNQTLIILFSAIGLALILSVITASVVRPTGFSPPSGFGHTLYGQVVGGKGWTQIGVDHPEASSEDYFQLAFEEFRSNPIRLLIGVKSAYLDYFNWDHGAFGYGFISNDDTDHSHLLFRRILYLLGIGGFLLCCFQYREPQNLFLVIFKLGILGSVPFIPPIDADGMRVYAATMPCNAIFPALAISALVSLTRDTVLKVPSTSSTSAFIATPKLDLLIPLCIILVLASTLFPIALKYLGISINPSSYECELFPHTLDSPASSKGVIFLAPDQPNSRTLSPYVIIKDFKSGLSGLDQYPKLRKALEALPEYSIIAFDFLNGYSFCAFKNGQHLRSHPDPKPLSRQSH